MAEKLGRHKRALKEAEELANAKPVAGDGLLFHEFPDYETYRQVQTAGNKAKIRMQFVKESHIEALADYLAQAYGDVSFGLCHGTRRGLEQAWFRDHLAGAPEVIGTEISDTADEFPNTVQWDFHEENPEWAGRADFVYSNSWDHAYDPAKAFRAWAHMLKPGGLMLLDHTKGHVPDAAQALDPFGATYEALVKFLGDELGDLGAVVDTVNRKRAPEYKARVLVFRRAG